MIDEDRLDELETLMPDVPDGARLSLPARDVRDLVRLIPCLRAWKAAAEAWRQAWAAPLHHVSEPGKRALEAERLALKAEALPLDVGDACDGER
jgi:hypothetical protein